MKKIIKNSYKVIIFFVISAFMYHYCTNIYQPKNMLGKDIRLFRNTPVWKLAQAVDKENVDKIRLLVKNKNMPIDFQEPRFGHTLLIWATRVGKEKSVETLLELGADPNLQNHYDGDNAIIEASDFAHYSKDWCNTNILKMILKYGGDPNSVSVVKVNDGINKGIYGGKTPLMNASSNCLKKVKILVDAGAEINYINEYGYSALKTAFVQQKADIVKYLLIEKKADFHNVDGILHSLRCWEFSLDSEDYIVKMEIVEYLKEQGIDYRSYPIPKDNYERFSQEYLDKY